jgi:molybdopterin-guanine dinucleotide biosynthesis protein A
MTALVILAGGRGTRLGHTDKAFIVLAGRTLLEHVIERVRGQVDDVAISANGDPTRFALCGCPVLADMVPGFLGPLAGIVAAMQWAAALGESEVATVPVDTPFVPRDLVARLRGAGGGGGAVCAGSAGRMHPVVALWPVDLADALLSALATGARRVDRWVGSCVDFPAERVDPFFNINTPADLARMRILLDLMDLRS